MSAKATSVTLTGATTGNFSQSFTQAFTWTELGAPERIIYPTCTSSTPCATMGRRLVAYGYDRGRLSAVLPYYATSIAYHSNGMLKQVTHARRGEHVSDGASDYIAADPYGMGRPYRIYTDGVTLPGSTFGIEGDWSSGTYSYDGAGNIKGLLKASDTLKPDDDTFTYDEVSRLTLAKIATADDTFVTQAYAYDAWGNMVTYGGQARDVSGTTNRLSNASYDARGNQTGWIWDAGDQRYRYRFLWDSLDRMTWHNGPGINRVLAYTADGERIVERDLTSGVTTISLRGLDAKVLREVKLQNGAYSWQKDYIYREGQILASHGNNEPLQHYHLDHLGTPRMLTNRCGERLQRFESFPFGEALAELPQHPEKMRLTGHQRDLSQPSTTEDDLDYMHARYYGTKMGRFFGVDPVRGTLLAPRSFNLFSYVVGNPLRWIDRFGLEPSTKKTEKCPTDVCVVVVGSVPSDEGKKPKPAPPTFTLWGSVPIARERRSVPWTISFPRSPRADLPMNWTIASRHKVSLSLEGFSNLNWLTRMVRNRGAWDFKWDDPTLFENYGNFHYGVVFTAADVPPQVTLRGAGAYQIWQRHSELDWVFPAGIGIQPWQLPTLLPPHGDEPKDHYFVRLAIEYGQGQLTGWEDP